MRKLRQTKSARARVIAGQVYLARNAGSAFPARCVTCRRMLTQLDCAYLRAEGRPCPKCGNDPRHPAALAARARAYCAGRGFTFRRHRVRGDRLEAEININARDRSGWIDCGGVS